MNHYYLKTCRKSLLAGVAVAMLVPATAWAEDAAETEPDHNAIIVSATKQGTSLQEASISVSAVSVEDLQAANITEITGLNGTVPGLVVAKSGGGERMVSIRGIGSETPENLNAQPGVSYHVDGVYIFNSIAANAAFIDVGQVEVLRGPQGTTFGQGSTGGTINVVTRAPSLTAVQANGRAGIGNYDTYQFEAGLNLPVSDTLAVRVAGQHYEHSGYSKATDVVGIGEYDLDDQDETAWRASLLWQPTDRFTAQLNTIQFHSDTHGPAQKNIEDPEPDPRVLSQDFPGLSIIDTELYYANLEYEFDFATIKSITSYQKLFSDQRWDADGLTADLFYDLTYNPLVFGGIRYDHVATWQSNNESWTQELNLTSNGDGPFQWIVGGVYLWTKNEQYVLEYRGSDDNLLRPIIPSDTAWDDDAIQYLTYATLQSVTREAWAAYGQGTYDLTDRLSLTAGLRYNYDKYSGTSDSMSGGTVPYTSGAFLQPSNSPGLSGDHVTGKLALEYELTPDNMIYASYTRGYKPGGLNSNDTSFSALGFETGIRPTYAAETVNSFELGAKNQFFDGSVQLNASAFYYDYSNMQFLDEDAMLFGEGTANAPSAEIYGLELEGFWDITPNLRFDATVAYLHGEFTEKYLALDPADASAAQIAAGYPDYLYWVNFYNAVLAREAARADIDGNDVPKLPEWQGSAALTYNAPVGPGELTARAQYIYRGDFYYRVFNNPVYDFTPSYEQVNLYLRYDLDGPPLFTSVSVTNLFDKAGVNSSFSDPYGSAQGFRTYIPPRQVIFSVGFNF
ncbi:TonB-dependent receptor [Aurantiacibacter flavus]|uniref:TonB-dependent receptor n=1 Tax=Aurantiacibacter flavus TaxID=3145232 RepID=A0ABV0D0W8_9SPHN